MMMRTRTGKRMLGLLTLALLTAMMSIPAPRAEGEDTVTVRGEVLDLACWLAHEAKGEGHAKCAQACVKGGQPMGLLTDKGTVYLLYAGHDDPAPFQAAMEHAGGQVTITGKPADRGGMKGLEVQAVNAG